MFNAFFLPTLRFSCKSRPPCQGGRSLESRTVLTKAFYSSGDVIADRRADYARMLAEGGSGRPRAAVVAIGGITADNAAPVIHAGADSIALISGLFDSSDIRATAARCKALFD